MAYGNGVTTYFTYEANTFRLKSLQTTKSSTTMQNLEYAYDPADNVQSLTDYLTSANSQTFTYDDLNRLLTGNSSAYGTISHTYNQIGNMLSNSQVGAYSYPASGASSVRPHAVSTAGSNSYTYDNNGNMLTGAGRTITYDFENRPTTIVSGGQTTTFTYDGDGGRVKKQTGSTVTWYISKLYECDGASCTKMIFSGSQRIVAKPVGQSSLYFYHGDHLGSTSVVTDVNGANVEALTYYPFGQTRTNVPGTPVNVAHKYTGKELDNATGLYFYEARYYDALLCRFISADTVVGNPKDPQDLNRYGYARNNPLKYTDPTGHFVWIAIPIAMAAGAIAAGIQSDWNSKAMIMGAIISGMSAGAGAAAGAGVGAAVGSMAGAKIGAIAGAVVGTAAGAAFGAAVLQSAGYQANIAKAAAAGAVGGLIGGGLATEGVNIYVSAIVGGVAAAATSAGLNGGKVIPAALMSAGVAAASVYIQSYYNASPAEAQAAAQASNERNALVVAASDTVCDVGCPLVQNRPIDAPLEDPVVSPGDFLGLGSLFKGLLLGGIRLGTHFSDDAAALIDLAREAARRGITIDDAKVLQGWAKELGVPHHPMQGIEQHINRNFKDPHIHIGPVDHIPVR